MIKTESLDFKVARLEAVRPETADTSTYSFTLESEPQFAFLPGQFNMVGLPGLDEAPFSISSLPEPGKSCFEHTIRHVGNVTRHLSRLHPGDRVLVRGPFGRSWPLKEIQGEDVLIVAGGLGLPPLRPLVLHCLRNRQGLGRLILIYGARTVDDMIFRAELRDWQDFGRMETRFCVDRLERGRRFPFDVSEGLVTSFLHGLELNPSRTRSFVCGPEIMMRFVGRDLMRSGHSKHRIYVTMERRMRCGTAHCGHCQIGAKFVCQDGPVFEYGDIARFVDILL